MAAGAIAAPMLRRLRGSACVADEASDHECEAHHQPRDRIKVLVASARRAPMPAGCSRAGSLDVCDVEQEPTGTGEQAEGGLSDRRS